MTTIGYQLEDMASKHSDKKPEHLTYMKNYVKSLKELGTNKVLSSRIRFMCQDLLEMRANNWNARREEEEKARGGKGGGKGGGGGSRGGNDRGGGPRSQMGMGDIRKGSGGGGGGGGGGGWE